MKLHAELDVTIAKEIVAAIHAVLIDGAVPAMPQRDLARRDTVGLGREVNQAVRRARSICFGKQNLAGLEVTPFHPLRNAVVAIPGFHGSGRVATDGWAAI